MEYNLQPSEFFLEQLEEFDKETLRIIENRLKLVKINPFRNKRIEGYNLFLFRIRVEAQHKEKRIIYLVDKPNVKILCILDRKNEYKDLKNYLKKLNL